MPLHSRGADMLVAFDLDDTLYKEADYVDSALRIISCGDERLYRKLKSSPNHYDAFRSLALPERERAIEIYRSGDIPLDDTEGAVRLLKTLKSAGCTVAIITDGHSRRQRKKIDRLGIASMVDSIIISEEIGSDKLSGVAFEMLENLYPYCSSRYYIGDNPLKDFIRANERGWTTIMIADSGHNIHSQQAVPPEMQPAVTVGSLAEILSVI